MGQYLKARLVSGVEIEFADEPFSEGGEKKVFWVKGKRSVIAFYFGTLKDRAERRNRLDNILGRYNPTKDAATRDFWEKHFWPIEILDGDPRIPVSFLREHSLVSPPLAVVYPAWRGNFFFKNRLGSIVEKEAKWFILPKPKRLVPPDELGDLYRMLHVCLRVARAVRRLHFAGLAHSDLSNKNVLIDPKGGEACIIDIDSLVVPDIAPPNVIGTPGYIAPEVMAGKALPSIATDRYALAVLIYELLFWRHPLEGPKVHSPSAEEDERLAKGEKAIFVEHPKDRSNRLKPAPRLTIEHSGPYLQPLFLKTFVEGLHHPDKRATVAEWETALYRTLDLLHPSVDGHWFILAPGMPKQCPRTKMKINVPVPVATFFVERKPGHFLQEKHTLTIYHNMYLHKWHVFSGISPNERLSEADRTPVGYFSFHQGRWVLVNQGDEPMQVIKGATIGRGQAVEITSHLKLRLSSKEGGRLAAFEFI